MTSKRPTTEEEKKAYLSAYLDFVSIGFESVVESTLDNAITAIISKQKEMVIQAKNSLDTHSINELNKTKMGMDYYINQLFDIESKEIIFALYELKIIYLHKHFEIYLKDLSKVSYKDWPNTEVYKCKDILDFYKSKNINLKDLNNYNPINDLTRVSNSLKHSGKLINKRIRNIPQFKGTNILNSEQLKAFYLKVKDAPKEFLKELSSTISSKLIPSVEQDYEFEIDKSTIEFDGELPTDR